MSARLPAWFKQKLPDSAAMAAVSALLEDSSLHTICQSALCPNSAECFARNTATFLILGDVCTRHCTFCAVKKGVPSAVDANEAAHLMQAARALGLRYVVVTSVTRDDLPDGGAAQFARVAETLHTGGICVEFLVPDFGGSLDSLKVVAASMPEVVNHNVETVPRLYSEVRPGADYGRSLQLLARIKQIAPRTITKSGLMLGLGEQTKEVIAVMKDLRQVGCDLLTVGQYLQPTSGHHSLIKFVTPDEFAEYARIAEGMGFQGVASAPLVRSSYHAAEMYQTARSKCEPAAK